MKKQIFLLLIITISVILFYQGCDKINDNNPVNPGGNSYTPSGISGQPIPTIKSNIYGVMAAILCTYNGTDIFVMGYAQFGLPDGNEAGTVSVNGNILTKQLSTSYVFYSSISPSNSSSLYNVNFDSSSIHTWSVSGSTLIPQFQASVSSPHDFTISAPVNNTMVPKTVGLSIQWDNKYSGNQDSIIVYLTPASTSISPYISNVISDSGSFTIPSSVLSSMPGTAILQVVKFRYKIVAESGNNYAIIAEVVRNLSLTIQ